MFDCLEYSICRQVLNYVWEMGTHKNIKFFLTIRKWLLSFFTFYVIPE